jgi:hypothetical protein
LVTLSVLPIIAVTGGIYITYKTTQASQSQEAYMVASVVAEEVSYIVYQTPLWSNSNCSLYNSPSTSDFWLPFSQGQFLCLDLCWFCVHNQKCSNKYRISLQLFNIHSSAAQVLISTE